MGLVTATCFVVAPFGPPFDECYREVLCPAINKAGLIPVRADEISRPGVIVNQIWEGICQSEVCLADVTGRNPNVMYELGIAHAVGKPVVSIVQNVADLPFDLQSHRCITYSTSLPSWAKTLGDRVSTMLFEVIKNPLGSIVLPRSLQKSLTRPTSLTITGVKVNNSDIAYSRDGKEIVGGDVRGVRVLAEVNSYAVSYPTRAVWAEPSEVMSAESFFVAESDEYKLRLELFAHGPEGQTARFISQEVQTISKSRLPVNGSYDVFLLGTGISRGSIVAASICYNLE